MAAPAAADSAPANPADPKTPTTVAADSLPTVQISAGTYNNRAGGVVWTQVVVGNTVYVGGDFTRARPAGAARGQNESTRTYLLAYDVRTGALLPFNHTLDGEVLAMTASPDGKRVYIGGAFNHVDGKWRVNIAAFNTSDGSLVEAFAPVASTKVLAMAASNTTLYVGGNFLKLAPKVSTTLEPRSYLGAFNAADGALLPWRADANAQVTAMTMSADGSRVVVGGRFNRINNTYVPGLGSLNPANASLQSFATNQYIQVMDGNRMGPAGNGGGTVTSLAADADGIYGGLYDFSGNTAANSEGVFRANPSTGALVWHADCHGDVYSVFPMGQAVYAASHQHWCQSIGGIPETRDSSPDYYRATAFSKAATGKVSATQNGYTAVHLGEPAPTMLNWYPQIPAGAYTGLKQGPWNVTGNGTYLVYGGEFTMVNNVAQEGLARFAVASASTNKMGPRLNEAKWANPVLRSTSPGQVVATIPANYDYDNSDLTYRLYRGTEVGGPVAEVKVSSSWYQRPTVTVTDTQAPAGTSQMYMVAAVDPFGNIARSPWVSVNVSGQVQQVKPGDTLASDSFTRSATGGWGRAQTGGGWVGDSKPAWYSVDGNRGRISIDEVGRTQRALLAEVKQANVDATVQVGLLKRPQVATTRLWVGARTTSDFKSAYMLRANVLPSGQVESLQMLKQVNGAQTTLAGVALPGVTLGDGEMLNLRFRVVGNQLQGKAWKVGTAEPGSWQLSLTDSSITAAGSVELGAYTGATIAPLPVVVLFDNLQAKVG